MPERSAQLLTPGALSKLERRLAAQDAPVVGHLRPGLPDEAIDDLMATVGLQLPTEVRLWWNWHDGTDAADDAFQAARQIGPRLQFLSLKQAIETHAENRKTMGEAWGEHFDLETYWPREWFPIGLLQGPAVCDCSVGLDQATPIRVMDPWLEPEGNREPVASSFGEAVSWWIEALDNNVWKFDSERGVWDYEWQGAGGPPRDRLV